MCKKRRGERTRKIINAFRETTSCCVFDVAAVELVPLFRWVGKDGDDHSGVLVSP